MRRLLVLALLLSSLCGCSAKRKWEERNATLEFDMHFGRPGYTELILEHVQLYDDRVLMLNCYGQVESTTLDSRSYDELTGLILNKEAIEALAKESSKGLYERSHVHFDISIDGKLEYFYVYVDGMPPSIAKYMAKIEGFLSKQFPGRYVPMKKLADQ